MYFINLAFVMILGLLIFCTGTTSFKKKIYIVIAYTSIFLVAGLRDVSVGTDTSMYQGIFSRMPDMTFGTLFSSRMEIGYTLINKILSIFTGQPQAITLLSSAIIVFGFAIFVYRNSNNVTVSTFLFLTLFFFAASINTERQFIAVMLVCNSFYYLKNAQIKAFIILILLASQFHISSIIFLPILALRRVKPNTFNFILIGVTSIFLGAILMYSNYIIMDLLGQYQVYIGTRFFENKAVYGTMLIWICQLLLACTSVYFLAQNKYKLVKGEREELFYLSLFMVFSVVMGLISTKLFIFERMTYYFGVFMIILIPKVLKEFKKSGLLLNMFMFCLLTYYYYYMLNSGTEGIVPYKFFFG